MSILQSRMNENGRQTRHACDDWGLLAKLEQDRDSAVGAYGSVDDYEVSYTHAKATGAARMVRLSGITLPSGAVLTPEYLDTDNRYDGKPGRVTQVKHGSTVVAAYRYMGGTA